MFNRCFTRSSTLKGEFRFFLYIVFFSFPRLLNKHQEISKNSKVSDGSFGSLKFAHRGPKLSKIVQNGSKLSKIVQNGPKLSKIVQNLPKFSKIVNIVQNGP